MPGTPCTCRRRSDSGSLSASADRLGLGTTKQKIEAESDLSSAQLLSELRYQFSLKFRGPLKLSNFQ